MKTIISLFKLIIVFSIVIMACKGPKGDVGPAGAAGLKGDPGVAGATGAIGAVGPAGKDGASGTGSSSNITTSNWIGIDPSDWRYYPISTTNAALDSTYFEVGIPDKNITQNVLDKGAVFVYVDQSGTGYSAFSPLPITIIGNNPSVINYLPYFETAAGGFLIISYESSKNRKRPGGQIAFRWVIIKDLTVSNGRLKNINWKNYEEVKRELNLKD